MKLIIAEKPSVAAAIAAALDVKNRKDGYIEGNGYLVSWCIGHLVGLAEAAVYGERYRKWSYDTLPILPETWQYTVSQDKGKQFKHFAAPAFPTKSFDFAGCPLSENPCFCLLTIAGIFLVGIVPNP